MHNNNPSHNKKNQNNEPDIQIHEDFEELLGESTSSSLQGGFANGVVVSLDKEFATIDIGGKSEGRVLLSEFKNTSELKIGHQVHVYVENIDGGKAGGVTLLSREKAMLEDGWKKIEESFKSQSAVRGAVIGKVKGGFAVKLLGPFVEGESNGSNEFGDLIAFLPGSQVDVRPIKEEILLEGDILVKIIKMDDTHGNLVISRRACIEETRNEYRDEYLKSIQVGSIVKGVVKNVTDYGAFIDLGPVDGLLYITDISWQKVPHPSAVLDVGQEIEAMIISYDPNTKRISLGLKQMQKNPWYDVKDKYQVKTKHKGVVTRIVNYGIFVDIEPALGICGLVHSSEISWTQKVMTANKSIQVGDVIEVMILEFNIEERKISLSKKQCEPNPWVDFIAQTPVGTTLNVVVKNVSEEFGLFVVPEQNTSLILLIPVLEIAWKNAQEKIKNYAADMKLQCLVLKTDAQQEKITCSIRAIGKEREEINPIIESLQKQESVSGIVTKVRTSSLEAEVAGEFSVHIDIANMQDVLGDTKDFDTTAMIGASLTLKIIGFDENNVLRVTPISIKCNNAN
ncbi:S1 RNA-binding domain-containing protein [Candidatus Fokinia crypta]|uniref:30S ribosomal protein S1 n=1 Tax=Candidatus Fokinia crypta TaxID=1920990 RepID=A0ABZ0UNG1_9RICK|nr:S1 RNA-binding domain-containing protein [Candidatus Fokinia cryptica]WPX97659.1 30S ribosomal protein S1 [Candidatus Fokinia cryptica]